MSWYNYTMLGSNAALPHNHVGFCGAYKRGITISERYESVTRTLLDALHQTTSERRTEHGYGQMAVDAATVSSAVAFGGIVLLYDEKSDEVHTA